MARQLLAMSALALLLASCGGTADPRNAACASQSQAGMRWGYYPGYGCGPVPPAQTKFP
jgi:hypothetical protein